ncbi:MAG TPA: alpha/beta hydrolase domain-containing protein [Casimicrobiaceae bacterium]|nr:alpha/beta hydrolase domain-containing protein [Casimicrobiaceae bacterium]
MSVRRNGATTLAPQHARRNLLRASIASAIAAGALIAAPATDARITKIQITSKESPTFGGYSFPGVGQYEKIVGKAFGEIDPNDPKNAVIADIKLAPRNANGKVEYSHDFYILKPIDLSKGNHRMMYEPPNRGGKTWTSLARVTGGGNDPGSITNAATLAGSFLMPRGFTMVWSGWDASAGTDNSNFNTTITLPVAKNADGSTITGPSYDYFIGPGTSHTLTYAAASTDQSKAVLTHRVHLDDQPQVVPTSGWTYNSAGTAISLLPAGTNFVSQDIYEFSYTAKDPTVNGIGFAAIRDFVAFLRYETKDDAGNANPLAGDVKTIVTEISSQPGRLLNDFDHLGFNQAENGKKVFDGHMNWIAAGDGISMNYRFSQPGRTNRNRQDLLFLEGLFPFAGPSTTDPISGQTAGRYDSCAATSTCPFVAQIYSANEYWVKAASLLHTTPDGQSDLADAPNARNYFISSHQHGTGSATSKGSCQQLQNPLNSAPVQRAMFLALFDWAEKGTPPPASRVPKFSDGTFAASTARSDVGFPNIPGVTYTGLKTTRYRFNYGPNFYTTGVMTIDPPVGSVPLEDNPAWGPIYPSFVPKTDADGNDIAGVRLPDVTVPLATYTGWALRSGPQANDGCEGSGQYIPFAKTKADRTASGDPRLSIEERYPNFSSYYFAVFNAINNFVANRWMLPEDAGPALNRMLQAGLSTGAIKLVTKEDMKLLEKAATVTFEAPALPEAGSDVNEVNEGRRSVQQ